MRGYVRSNEDDGEPVGRGKWRRVRTDGQQQNNEGDKPRETAEKPEEEMDITAQTRASVATPVAESPQCF